MTDAELQRVIDKVIRSTETLADEVAALVEGKVLPATMKKRAENIHKAALLARVEFDQFD